MELLDIRDALARIRLEFTHMPELRISRAQLCRLLSLPPDTCEIALGALVHSGFLERGPDGQFRRAAVNQSRTLASPLAARQPPREAQN